MVPEIDKHIGIEVYSTPITTRPDASIRYRDDSFIVEEVIDLDPSSISWTHDKIHRYALFRLRKRGIDTIHALKEIRLEYNIRLKVLGLKDACASTTQYAIAGAKESSKVIKLLHNNGILSTKHCTLEFMGYTESMISKRYLLGNTFYIKLTVKSNIQHLIDTINMVKEYVSSKRVANFYGYQRFGSIRAVTHLVGKAIVKRMFDDAVNILLTYTTEYESREHRGIRLTLRNDGLSKELIESIPYTMDLERVVAKELLNNRDPIRALRALPIEVRRLFVEAYQAYIFNRTLSKALREGYDISRVFKDDLCFSKSNRGLGEIKVADSCDDNAIVAVPLVGYALRPKGRFGMLLQDILKEEGINSKDFYIKEMQEVSLEGGFRPAPLMPLSDIEYDVIGYDNNNNSNSSIALRFGLHKGSYATILLREIIKPTNPFLQGF